ncbi:MAG: hypothetical protein JWP24_667 [Marmoricola sp.]|nr:hypothetical protein [Marmoricola sp.]
MRLVPRHPRWLLAVGVLVVLVAVVGVLTTYEDTTRPGAVDRTGAWVSSPTDPGRRLLEVSRSSEPATASVRVNPADLRQTWRGTGAAMTDSSVQMLSAAPDGVRRLFDPAAGDGARLSWIRLPLTATDMSPQPWTWGWDGAHATPSPQAESAAAIVVRVAALQPQLRVVATPWTAPKWMKQPPEVRGGALRDDALDQYAAMLVAQADELRTRGVPLRALTPGNEPGRSADYPSMTMTAAQQAQLGRLMGPKLHGRGLELWAVDHNWADRAVYDEVLAAAPGVFDAAAFHCYAGTPDQMAGVALPPIVTECTGTTSSWSDAFAWDMQHLVGEGIASGSTGLMTWNLAVDPHGGPRDATSAAGCSSCRGLLTVDGSRAEPGPEFYVLAQLARAADPGARVVGSRASAGVSAAAFTNVDGTVGVVAYNGTGKDSVVSVAVQGRRDLRARVRAGELMTVRAAG